MTLAERSSDPFPIVDTIWNMFARKGNKTVFLSIGGSKHCLADLELAETLGCPFHVAPIGAQMRSEWEEVAACLKARSRPAEAHLAFSEGAEEKWILPKNFRRIESLPWWTNGSISISGESVPLTTAPFFESVNGMCRAMNLPETRLDILKVDCSRVAKGLERGILTAMLEHNLRPAILLVRWSVMPDTDTATSITAGHLQNSGYTLAATLDDKFLYFYTDQDMYMTCSWEDTSTVNPLVKQIAESVQSSLTKLEGRINEGSTSEESVAPGRETISESSAATPSGRA